MTRRYYRAPRRTAGGVTLPGLLLGAAVAGVLTGLAIPAFNSLGPQVGRSMVTLDQAFWSTRQEAMMLRHDLLVEFDASGNQLRIVYDANGTGKADAGEKVRTVALEPAITFGRGRAPARAFGPEAVNFPKGPSGLPTLAFRPDGRTSTPGGLYLTSIKAAAGDLRRASDTRAIEFAPGTGRAEWSRWNGAMWVPGF